MIKPHLIIGGLDRPYMLRWHLIPKNRMFNVYLHKFLRSDDDRALHDHPWLFNMSILLTGSYIEEKPANRKDWPKDMERARIKRRRFIPYFRWGKAPHRVELMQEDVFIESCAFDRGFYEDKKEKPVWTIFITGPRVREWGFYCPKGWRLWKEYVSNGPGTSDIGRGCE